MNILVLGALSHLGVNFIRKYSKRFTNVIAVDKVSYCSQSKEIINGYVSKFIEIDIVEADLENIIVFHSITFILNTAASTHVDRSYTHFDEFINDNINCVSTIMNTMVSLKKLKYEVKLIHLSTDEVYGDNYDTVRCETDMLNPTNPYSASKASGDMIINSYCNSYDLFEDIIVLRPNNMAGCFQYPDKVIPLFIEKILKNETIYIHGDGEQKRCFISTEFVSEIIFTLFFISHKWNSELFYNVSFNDQSGLSVNSVYKTIKYTLMELNAINYTKNIDDLKPPIFSKDRPYNDKIYKISNIKLCNFLENCIIKCQHDVTKDIVHNILKKVLYKMNQTSLDAVEKAIINIVNQKKYPYQSEL
jgi:dTDP-glucose 4,6-dehydratase